MKDAIKEKFDGIKHKWIYYHIATKTFHDVVDTITTKIYNKEITIWRLYNENDVTYNCNCFRY